MERRSGENEPRPIGGPAAKAGGGAATGHALVASTVPPFAAVAVDRRSPLFSPPQEPEGGLAPTERTPTLPPSPPALRWSEGLPTATFGQRLRAAPPPPPNATRAPPPTAAAPAIRPHPRHARRAAPHRRTRPSAKIDLRAASRRIEGAARRLGARIRARVSGAGTVLRRRAERNDVARILRRLARSSARKLIEFDSAYRVTDAVVSTACASALLKIGGGMVVAGMGNLAAAGVAAALASRRREREERRGGAGMFSGPRVWYADLALREDAMRRRGY